MPAFSLLAALGFLIAARSYEQDIWRIQEQMAAESAAADSIPGVDILKSS
ncbi:MULTISPECIES: hypothetical protein [Cupriavidus]|nr:MULTISPECIES: hypothetical protein [Cupriavidus]MBF6988996.1 hypothetical protein [Cupriavidus sp. IK-TO18]